MKCQFYKITVFTQLLFFELQYLIVQAQHIRGSKDFADFFKKGLGDTLDTNIIGLDTKSSTIKNQASEFDFIAKTKSKDIAGPIIPIDMQDEIIAIARPENTYTSKVNDIATALENTKEKSVVNESLKRICETGRKDSNTTQDMDSFLFSDLDGWKHTQLSGKEQRVGKEVTVGVYYYPWYAKNFHGRKYMRERLIPKQSPLLGEYSDRDCEVIGQHLIWSRYAQISVWVASWWGPGKQEDETILEHILTNPFLEDTKIAIHYETAGRTKLNRTSESWTSLHNIGPDMTYLARNYFDHPNYYRIQGRPVIVVYLARVLDKEGLLQNATMAMRSAAAELGHDVYIIGDYCFGRANSFKIPGMQYLDAVTNFDAYGAIRATGYIGWDNLNKYFENQREWKIAAKSKSISYIPVVTPGYNDKGVREGHAPASRKISLDEDYGSLFRAMIGKAIKTSEELTGNLLLINSFNEWHEDTQIEPVAESPPTTLNSGVLESLSSPNGTYKFDYTEGLAYEGYGKRYLDILRSMVGFQYD